MLEGDALGPLLDALEDDGVAAAGWRGVDVDDGWLGFPTAGRVTSRRCSATCWP